MGNNKETLERAVRIACKNGFTPPYWWDHEGYDNAPSAYVDCMLFGRPHYFAKALWGDNKVRISIDDFDTNTHGPQPLMGGTAYYPYHEGSSMDFVFTAWKYHLQQMVIADDPIGYLSEHLPTREPDGQ